MTAFIKALFTFGITLTFSGALICYLWNKGEPIFLEISQYQKRIAFYDHQSAQSQETLRFIKKYGPLYQQMKDKAFFTFPYRNNGVSFLKESKRQLKLKSLSFHFYPVIRTPLTNDIDISKIPFEITGVFKTVKDFETYFVFLKKNFPGNLVETRVKVMPIPVHTHLSCSPLIKAELSFIWHALVSSNSQEF
jgi:hypothetical protein